MYVLERSLPRREIAGFQSVVSTSCNTALDLDNDNQYAKRMIRYLEK